MRPFVVFAVFSLPLCCFTGCGPTKATLFVDNDSKSSIRVEIEGQKSLYVGPNKSGKRHLPYGEHKVTVKRKGKVIFEGKKNFEPHPNGPAWRHYLLDPEADTTYAVREFFYYKDRQAANNNAESRYVQQLYRKNWVEVPKGATALSPSTFVVTSETGERASQLCVVRDR